DTGCDAGDARPYQGVGLHPERHGGGIAACIAGARVSGGGRMMLDESPTTNLLSMPSRAITAPNDDPPLPRVSLLYIEQRINLYLRFGCPLRVHQIDRWRRCAVFSPAQLFCRIRWESNDYGTTRWQLIVLRSGRPEERMQRVRGVRPGCQWPFILPG